MKKIQLIYILTIFWPVVLTAQSQSLPQLGKSSIEEVIAAMTLEEKAALVVGTGLKFGDSIENSSAYKIPNQPIPGSLAAKTKVYVVGAIGRTLEISRLGITSLEMVDGPAGVSFGSRTTAFPIATALASTWDVDQVYEIGQAMGNETLEYGFDLLLAPAINIHRNPLTGRNFEYFSEDPLVSGRIGAAMVRGIQSQGVGTSLKHFAANNQETNRIEVDAIVSERALREIYLRGFEIAIKESNPWTLMASYNSINGSLASENHDLLTTIARDDWDYQGLIMTDWEAGIDPVAQMKAGLNLIMPGPYQNTVLIQAVKEERLAEEVLDQNVGWILKGVMKGQKFNRYAFSNNPDFDKNAQLVRQAAADGMVLLKNENSALPLNDPNQTIALFGNGSYETVISGSGSGFVMNAGPTTQMVDGLIKMGFKVSEELHKTYQSYISENTPEQNLLDLSRGRKIRAPEMAVDKALIEQMANQFDYAIITIARMSGETTDRSIEADFELTKVEISNIESISKSFQAQGKKVAVVLNIGGVVETASWKHLPDAILIAWQPGQEAGHSIADVISGKINPSGKLTASFPMRYEDVPSSKNFPGNPVEKPKEVIYEEGIYVGYRYYETFDVNTSYPFGYGLSYTDFDYSNMELSSPIFSGEVELSLTITNTGKLAGREVVQLYISAPTLLLDKPAQELKGFTKTRLLNPGQSEKITFKIDGRSLSSFHTDQSAWIAEAGDYLIKVGTSSDDIKLSKLLDVPQNVSVQEVLKALIPQRNINEFNNSKK